jgi:hypothetical protein
MTNKSHMSNVCMDMAEDYCKFLDAAARTLRHLAEQAPDIGRELRRFAEDLDRLAAELARSNDASPEGLA